MNESGFFIIYFIIKSNDILDFERGMTREGKGGRETYQSIDPTMLVGWDEKKESF